MIFFHRTNSETWQKIKKEGVLWGIHEHRRYTYLASDRYIDGSYGDVLLEVEYKPTGVNGVDNYGFDPPEGQYCWQFSVFDPIPIKKVKRVYDPEFDSYCYKCEGTYLKSDLYFRIKMGEYICSDCILEEKDPEQQKFNFMKKK